MTRMDFAAPPIAGRVSVSAAVLANNWEMVRTHRTRGSRLIPAGELGAERYAQALHKQKVYALEESDCDLTVDHRGSWGDICRRLLVSRTESLQITCLHAQRVTNLEDTC
jgi:hypothetical protein